jgi:hypothetical protein
LDDDEETTADLGVKYEALYPDPIMTLQQVQYGGFLLYLVGILYSFIGISLVTQNYINPAIDTIKKKGIVSFLFIFIFLDRFRYHECDLACFLELGR